MTCHDTIDRLLYYLSDTMPEEERRQFEGHLAACPECVNYVQSYRETIRLCQTAFTDPAPGTADIPEELVRAIVDSAMTQAPASQ
jgi:anti-sigma factor RsiW